MNSFFKFFFASVLALFVFSILLFFIGLSFVSGLAAPEKVKTGNKAVLVVDLSKPFMEIKVENPLAGLSGEEHYDLPSLYETTRLIRHAIGDSAVKGIYIKCERNSNGFASSEALRQAIADFKKSGKFVIAYGDVISQGGYAIGNVADKIYCNPKGGVDWKGYAIQLAFLKGLLQKLEIEPQIFYAGKFKSATEPFRETHMTDANRLQLTVLLNELYTRFLQQSSDARHIDTATLRSYATGSKIHFASDALHYGLVDGLKYEDQVHDEMRKLLKLGDDVKINFIEPGKYARAVNYKKTGKDKIAVIFAQGDIVDGKGDRDLIGDETYVELIRKARVDAKVKAIVLRINSGGGSSQASENMWRELSLARKEKPVVVSFGDVAASGGYYMSCNADSIFAQPNTITGSIGVFSILPNMQKFFNNKLGITFDEVKTAEDADIYSAVKPLTESQRHYLQSGVDSTYETFKERVSQGRQLTMEYVDSIGQGRVWSGTQGLKLGLVDRLGNLDDAIACAARMAKTNDYGVNAYPEPHNIFDLIFGNYRNESKKAAIKEELGEEGMQTYSTITKVKRMIGVSQARLPFIYTIE